MRARRDNEGDNLMVGWMDSFVSPRLRFVVAVRGVARGTKPEVADRLPESAATTLKRPITSSLSMRGSGVGRKKESGIRWVAIGMMMAVVLEQSKSFAGFDELRELL